MSLMATLCFVAGAWLFYRLPALPPLDWLWAALPLALLLRWGWTRWPALCGLGLLWSLLHLSFTHPGVLPTDLQGRDLQLEGVVASMPQQRGRRTRFELDVGRLLYQGQVIEGPRRVRLSLYGGYAEPAAGERWRFRVRLKRPRGFANPGGFDYARWLFRKGIGATGYVREAGDNRRLGEGGWRYGLLRLRERLRDEIGGRVSDPAAAALLAALTVGDRSGLSRRQWDLYTRLGVNHLVAISGLHIGIMAGLGFLIGRWLWRRGCALPGPWGARIAGFSAEQAGAILALLLGAVYAALAGFAVPTQRALIMLLVVLGAWAFRRGLTPARSLAAALWLVVLWNPMQLLSAGLWLSFGAVAAILIGMAGRRGARSLIAGWGRVQWVVALGLAPVLIAQGLGVPLLGPLVNLLSVPLFSLVVVPLALLGTAVLPLWAALGEGLLAIAAELLGQWEAAMALLGGLEGALWRPAEAGGWRLVAALLGVVLLLAPRGLPGRWLGVPLLLPLAFPAQDPPPFGTLRFTLLDVGQGQAAVLRTQRHLLVYDAGPRYSADFETGSQVVAPYLQSRGLDLIDRLVLSNADRDHAGGFHGLIERVPAREVWSGEPGEFPDHEVRACAPGQAWSWDGVRFDFLHGGGRWSGNDASCVLRVRTRGATLLLTGDIEAPAERSLVGSYGEGLAADLLIVPHHGSATSSTPALVGLTEPDYALVSAGYRNRWGFPRGPVVARWRQAGARVLNTADHGALSFELTVDGLRGPRRYRDRVRRLWSGGHFAF